MFGSLPRPVRKMWSCLRLESFLTPFFDMSHCQRPAHSRAHLRTSTLIHFSLTLSPVLSSLALWLVRLPSPRLDAWRTGLILSLSLCPVFTGQAARQSFCLRTSRPGRRALKKAHIQRQMCFSCSRGLTTSHVESVCNSVSGFSIGSSLSVFCQDVPWGCACHAPSQNLIRCCSRPRASVIPAAESPT
jgi:hypothetical protein